jgi:dTDP-4-amino-4,6-dideoxygalactose transaminase/2-polyprenyl-3-methyl-5-hydroxy-6-metoxy-1,4-benzoquinol methylase
MAAPRRIERCRVCGNTNLRQILDLGEQALTGRFVRPEEPDPTVGPLQLVLCHGAAGDEHCGLLQLAHTYELTEMYGESYGYRSALSGTMVQHLRQIAARAQAVARPAPGDAVLDIGCSDGTLLGFYDGAQLKRRGVDPSSARFRAEFPPGAELLVDFFSRRRIESAFGRGAYKIVTSIAMFYDLDDPMAFMRDVRDILAPDGIWITEQAHMGTMLTNLAFDSVCHEHLNYYNLRQIAWMAARCGLRVLDVELNAINGASFCVTLCRSDAPLAGRPDAVAHLLEEERASFSTLLPYATFADRITLFRRRVRTFFDEAREAGELVLGYGASTKGNVVLQYCGIGPREMPAIAEKYPLKFGLVTPGTRIPIVSEEEARARKPDYFFVLPWHFRDEIVQRERAYLEGGGALVFALPRFEIVRTRTRPRFAAPAQRRLAWAEPSLFGDEGEWVQRALASTFISDGPYVERIESEMAQHHGLPPQHAVTVANGTVALELALRALGVGPGDEVIVPGWCFAAAANMTLAVGARPVFADIEPDTWLIDAAGVERLVSPRTKAIAAVHTWGNVCDMAALRRVAERHRLCLIEDCAESLFSRYRDEPCGRLGDIATFSFQATKTLTCGEGGMLLARDPALVERMRLIRNHGMQGARKYWHHLPGHNFRLTNIQAAVLCAQWQHREEIVAMRRRLLDAYRRRLAEVRGLAFQEFRSEVQAVPWALGIRIAPEVFRIGRDDLMQRLAEDGIECRPGFYAASQQPIYNAAALPCAEAVAAQTFSPPISPRLSELDLDYICDRILARLS